MTVHCVHPLLNDLIIANVFQHLPSKDLTTCRLTCHFWNHEGIRVLRQRVNINLSGFNTKYIMKFVESMKCSVGGRPSSSSNMSTFPYTNFTLTIWDQETLQYAKETYNFYNANNCAPIPIPYAMTTFLGTFGPFVRQLQLSINDFERCLNNRVHRIHLASALPNLQKLILVGQSSVGLEHKNRADPIHEDMDKDQIFANVKSLTLIDNFAERDIEMKYAPRFNEQFVHNVFAMCPNIRELTVDTKDCRTRCSLVESVLNVLKNDSGDHEGEFTSGD